MQILICLYCNILTFLGVCMPIVCKNFSELQKNVLIEALTFMRDFDKKKTPEKFEFLKIQALKCGFDLRKIKSKSSLNSADLTLLINKIDNITIKRNTFLHHIIVRLNSFMFNSTVHTAIGKNFI